MRPFLSFALYRFTNKLPFQLPILSQSKSMSDQEDVTMTKQTSDAEHGSITQVSLGENNDDAVLRANGHKSELKRQFNWLSALGLGFSITNSWAGYLVRTPFASHAAIQTANMVTVNRVILAKVSPTGVHRSVF